MGDFLLNCSCKAAEIRFDFAESIKIIDMGIILILVSRKYSNTVKRVVEEIQKNIETPKAKCFWGFLYIMKVYIECLKK